MLFCVSAAESGIVYFDPAIKSQDDPAIKVFHFTPGRGGFPARELPRLRNLNACG